MGREVRRVPAHWQHPKDADGHYIPLLGGSFSANVAAWDEGKARWDAGERPDYCSPENRGMTFQEWEGRRPVESLYMPEWPESERTHLQMYENTSEGTPLSPVMETAEQLARWLSDNHASAFAGMTATYEQWLATIQRGWAPSAVIAGGVMSSGVAVSEKLK